MLPSSLLTGLVYTSVPRWPSCAARTSTRRRAPCTSAERLSGPREVHLYPKSDVGTRDARSRRTCCHSSSITSRPTPSPAPISCCSHPPEADTCRPPASTASTTKLAGSRPPRSPLARPAALGSDPRRSDRRHPRLANPIYTVNCDEPTNGVPPKTWVSLGRLGSPRTRKGWLTHSAATTCSSTGWRLPASTWKSQRQAPGPWMP